MKVVSGFFFVENWQLFMSLLRFFQFTFKLWIAITTVFVFQVQFQSITQLLTSVPVEYIYKQSCTQSSQTEWMEIILSRIPLRVSKLCQTIAKSVPLLYLKINWSLSSINQIKINFPEIVWTYKKNWSVFFAIQCARGVSVPVCVSMCKCVRWLKVLLSLKNEIAAMKECTGSRTYT